MSLETVTLLTIQNAPVVDHISADGQEYTQLPYPFHVAPSGLIQQQDFWRGKVAKVIGFQNSAFEQRIDLWWSELLWDEFLEGKIRGKYLVVADDKGSMSNFTSPVDTATYIEVPKDSALLAPAEED
jgi:hypothetical protein